MAPDKRELARANSLTGPQHANLAKCAATGMNASYAGKITQRDHAQKGNGVNADQETPTDTQQQERGRTLKKRRKMTNEPLLVTSAPKISRKLFSEVGPTCQSALNTVTAIPPPTRELTSQEKELLANMDKNIFKITTPINIKTLDRLTFKHPNRPYIKYILNGLRHGFRYGFTHNRRKVI